MNDALITMLLKGVRLAVYLFLSNHPEGLTQRNLEIKTGSTDKTVSAALEYLKEAGLAIRTRAHDNHERWFVTAGLEVERVGDSPTPIIIIKDITESINQESKTIGVGKIPTLPEGKPAAEVEAIWAELYPAGVLRNNRTDELVQMPHITPEYVKAKRDEFKRRKQGGMAFAPIFIQALEQNQPIEEGTNDEPARGKTIDQQVEDFLRRGSK
jgi:hypothetical protein